MRRLIRDIEMKKAAPLPRSKGPQVRPTFLWNRKAVSPIYYLVSTPRHKELKLAIETYQRLIANYTLARERILERRRGAADHVMVELDERLEANKRTTDALQNAVEITREHLKLLEQGLL